MGVARKLTSILYHDISGHYLDLIPQQINHCLKIWCLATMECSIDKGDRIWGKLKMRSINHVLRMHHAENIKGNYYVILD